MTQEPKHAFWAQQIQAWEHSQLGQKQFCRQHSLSYPQFCYWRKRLKRQTPAAERKLIPVMLSAGNASVGIYLPFGVRLDVPTAALAEVLPLICRTARELT
jgi:hypothetical protein